MSHRPRRLTKARKVSKRPRYVVTFPGNITREQADQVRALFESRRDWRVAVLDMGGTVAEVAR